MKTFGLVLTLLIATVVAASAKLPEEIIAAKEAAVQKARAGQFDEGLKLLEMLSQNYPNEPALIHDRVVLLSEAGRNQQALLLFQKLEASKTPAYVIHAAVDACRETQQSDLGLKLVNEQIQNKPKPIRWRIRRAQLLVDKGESAAAIKELAAMQGITQTLPAWLEVRIQAATSIEDWPAVLRYNSQRLKSQPQPNAVFLRTQLDALLHSQKYPEALATLDKLSQHFPNDYNPLQERLVVLVRMGQSQKSLDLLKKIDSQQAPDYVIQAAVKACRELGKTSLALKLVNSRLTKTPKSIPWKIRHAQLLVDDNQAAKAAADLETFREVRKHYPDWLDVRIYAARMAEDWMQVLRYSKEKSARKKKADLPALGSQVDALIHLGAAHAAERILQQHPEVLTASRQSHLLERISGVELRWSGHASVTMKERIQRASVVIQRLDRYAMHSDSSLQKNYLRIVALHNANRWDEAVQAYEKLRQENELPAFVTSAAAGSYLALRQPETARQLYQKVLAAGFTEDEASSGYFYALIECEDLNAAAQFVDHLAKNEPPFRHYSGSPESIANGLRLDLEMMRSSSRYFSDQLHTAWTDVDRMKFAAPGNNWLREMHAKMALARGWQRQALDEYRVAASVNPHSPTAQVGIATSLLQMSDYQTAEKLLLDLETDYPENSSVKQLRKDWDIYEMPELWSNFIFMRSQGPELDGDGILATAEYYGSAINYNWRPLLQARYAWAEIIEGQSSFTHIAAGAEYRSPQWEFSIKAGYLDSQQREKGTGSVQATWKPDDHWRMSAEYSSFNANLPLRALWYGITADLSKAAITYQWHESRQLNLLLMRSSFSDDNERWEAGISFQQRLIDRPHFDVDGLLNAYGSHNSRKDAPYFNPRQDLSLSTGLDAEHILWRRYDQTWVHHLRAEMGYYDQQGFNPDWTTRLAYDHRLTLFPDWEFVIGVVGGRRIYDGNPEPFYGFNLLIHARF